MEFPNSSTAAQSSSTEVTVATTPPVDTASTTTAPPTTAPATTTAQTTTEPADTAPPSTQVEAPETTDAASTTTVPVVDEIVFEGECVVQSTGTSFEAVALDIADVVDVPVSGPELWVESGFAPALAVGEPVDICIGNGINDIDESPQSVPDESAVAAARIGSVQRQQEKLNELFAPFGAGDLAVDGDSGRRTGQRLCGARLALGFDTNVNDMEPGSIEAAALFGAPTLPTPENEAGESDRWVVIDRTCQLLFAGTGSTLTFAFNTSTGSEGFETRVQDQAEAFRFNPAVANGGWHDSSEFPVGVDNPLNGNMFKPLYFDLGQAIHGANNVPSVPDSKGCARLTVGNQVELIGWLGLADAPGETWRKNEMDVVVTVQGEFIGR